MVTVRDATRDDVALIHRFIRALADYEKLLHEVEASEADVGRDLFGPNPRVFCDIAENEGAAVGFALWFYNFSTFQGRAGIYLEDLYVREAARGTGVGGALCVPIRKNGKIIGTLGIGTMRQHEYTPGETQRLEAVANSIAASL